MRTLIEIDGLFDGERTVENAAVVIEDGRIAWVGKRGRAPKSKTRTESVRPPGAFALPGFVNCHSHLTLDGRLDFTSDARAPEATLALKAFRNARAQLRSGVTTVRDLGANGAMVVELGRAIAAGMVEGPRIIAAARGLTTTGGHGADIGRMADGADGVRQAVREQLMAGATVIKLFSTGGVVGEGAAPEVSQFTTEETEAAVAEAHRHGVRITTHAHGGDGIRIAASAGIDSIEHATLMDQRTVKLLKEKDVAIVPTMSALAALVEHADELPPAVRERTFAVAERSKESIRMAHRAGVRIAAGTDAGTPFNLHDRFVLELELLRSAGLDAPEVLVAATSGAAAVVGREDVGRIAAGAYADLVFVDGDPLRDVTALRRPAAVWLSGVPAS
ncbi:MAG TPA: amidohydrolase family protein [Candidatus Limnocylindria bacterium]